VALLGEAWAATEEPLVADQCEHHPYLQQDKLKAEVRKRGMIFTAYSPLARGAILSDPVIARIAMAKGRTPSQVALRWLIQQPGIVTIPASSKPEHIRANFAIFDFSLDDADMAAISALGQSHRKRVADPGAGGPKWDT
jgi:diketogulonate reductase-like aldo/keto reductase